MKTDNTTSSRRRVAWALALLGALLTAGAWSLASPPGSSPDDNFHVGTIWCKSVWHSDRCEFLETAPGAYGQAFHMVPPQATFSGAEASPSAPCYVFNNQLSGACPVPQENKRLPINDGLYPPVYYAFAGLFAAESMEQTVVQVRLAVSLSVIVLLAAAYRVSLAFLRPAFLASVAVGLVPLGLSMIASTNPSGWAIPAVMASWVLAVTTMLAPTTGRRIAAGAVWLVSAVMACGSRSDAGAYIAVIAVLAIVVLWSRATWGSRLTGGLVVTISALTLLSSGQTSNVTTGFLEVTGGRSTATLLWQAIKGIPGLWAGATGAPGGPTNNGAGQLAWFDVPIPPTAWAGLLMVAGALMMIGITWMPWQKGTSLAVLATTVTALPLYVLVTNKAIPGELVQPRYLLPLVLVVFGLAMVRSSSDPLRLTRLQAIIAAVVVAVAQTLSLQVYMRRFINGLDTTDGPSLANSQEWWWNWSVSPDLVWLAGSVGWTLIVIVAFAHLRPASDSDRGDRPRDVTAGQGSETLAREDRAWT